MVSNATMSTQHFLNHLIFRQLRLTTAVETTVLFALHRYRHRHRHNPLPKFSLLHVTRTISTTPPLHCTLQETIPPAQDLDKVTEPESENESGGEGGEEKVKSVKVLEKREVPELSVKEKKELGSYAKSLGDKLKGQQIGKSGVTGNVAFALEEILESNELVKLKILRSCPGELEDIVRQLEEATGSVVVGQIGRTVILYRPSVTKLKAEEKKEQNRKLFEKKRKKFLAAPTTVERWKKNE